MGAAVQPDQHDLCLVKLIKCYDAMSDVLSNF